MRRGPKPKRPPAAPACRLDPPAALGKRERLVFRWVVRTVGQRLQPEDLHAVEQYARAVIRYRDLCALEREQGTNHKTLGLISQARAELESASSRLGMSPRDRARLRGVTIEERPKSALEQLLAERDS